MMEYKVHSRSSLTTTPREDHKEIAKTKTIICFIMLSSHILKGSFGTHDFKIEPILSRIPLPRERRLKVMAATVKLPAILTKMISTFDYGLGFGLDLRINRDMLSAHATAWAWLKYLMLETAKYSNHDQLRLHILRTFYYHTEVANCCSLFFMPDISAHLQ